MPSSGPLLLLASHPSLLEILARRRCWGETPSDQSESPVPAKRLLSHPEGALALVVRWRATSFVFSGLVRHHHLQGVGRRSREGYERGARVQIEPVHAPTPAPECEAGCSTRPSDLSYSF